MADAQQHVRPERISSIEGRRACLGTLTAGLGSLLMPKPVLASEELEGREVLVPVPIAPAIIRALVGTYEVRREWLFEGKVLVEKARGTVTTGPLWEELQPEWVEHWRAPLDPLTTEICVKHGRLEVQGNYKWAPLGLEELGPGPLLSTRIDGKRETVTEGRGLMKLLHSEEREEYNINLSDGVRHVQEWWVRRSSESSWEGVKTRTVTLWIESPGMLALRVNEIQTVTDKFWQSIASLRFRRIA